MIKTAANPSFLRDRVGRRAVHVGSSGTIAAHVRRPAMRRQRLQIRSRFRGFRAFGFLTRHYP
jgi:hypothetical protein